MNLHFISGLPRSGSTLFAALLRTNPRFHASISSPLAHVYDVCYRALGVENEAVDFISDGDRLNMLCGLFQNFYDPHNRNDRVIFDTSRAWSARWSELFELFPQSKMIILVRPANEILNSFERVYQSDPLTGNRMFGSGSNSTGRALKLLAGDGVLGHAIVNTKDAFFNAPSDRLLVIRYATLMEARASILKSVCSFLGLEFNPEEFSEPFTHIPGAAEFDRRLGMKNLHPVAPEIATRTNEILIPPEIWQSNGAQNTAFWAVPELNRKGIKVL